MNNIIRIVVEKFAVRNLGYVLKEKQRKVLFEVMTCLQFYQSGMENPSALGVYLSSLMNFDIMDFHLLL